MVRRTYAAGDDKVLYDIKLGPEYRASRKPPRAPCIHTPARVHPTTYSLRLLHRCLSRVFERRLGSPASTVHARLGHSDMQALGIQQADRWPALEEFFDIVRTAIDLSPFAHLF